MMERHYSECLDEEYYSGFHKSGLKVIVFPKPKMHTAYAIIGTKYGSVNTGFTSGGNHYDIPDGTAHFLEHKMFEGKTLNAFDRFSETGADANAYTSFDKTAYLFSSTDKIYESLEILLDFVSNPYFTKENVAKEQGIIGQEIQMYDDDPDWQTFFRAIDAAYTTHPIKKDIAGTRETIATITPELLYEIHKNFYSGGNMTLCVAGPVEPEKVMKSVEKSFSLTEKQEFTADIPTEKDGIFAKRTEKSFPVSKTMFGIAIKTPLDKKLVGDDAAKLNISVNIALKLISGDSSKMFNELYSANKLIDYSTEYMLSDGYAVTIASGSSDNPEEIYDRFFKEAEKIKNGDIDGNDFEGAVRSYYARIAAVFDSPDGVANSAMSADFLGYDIFKTAELLRSVTKEDVSKAAAVALSENNAAMSVIRPMKEE